MTPDAARPPAGPGAPTVAIARPDAPTAVLTVEPTRTVLRIAPDAPRAPKPAPQTALTDTLDLRLLNQRADAEWDENERLGDLAVDRARSLATPEMRARLARAHAEFLRVGEQLEALEKSRKQPARLLKAAERAAGRD